MVRRDPFAGPTTTAMLCLSDLREWHVIEAACNNCGHVGRLRPKKMLSMLWRRHRRETGQIAVVDLAPRLACSECGNRGGNSLRVVRLDRNV